MANSEKGMKKKLLYKYMTQLKREENEVTVRVEQQTNKTPSFQNNDGSNFRA